MKASLKQKNTIVKIIVTAMTIALGTWLVVQPIKDYIVELLGDYGTWFTVLVGFTLITIGVLYATKITKLINGK